MQRWMMVSHGNLHGRLVYRQVTKGRMMVAGCNRQAQLDSGQLVRCRMIIPGGNKRARIVHLLFVGDYLPGGKPGNTDRKGREQRAGNPKKGREIDRWQFDFTIGSHPDSGEPGKQVVPNRSQISMQNG
jgi:hypothetical protein